ncbi:MAG TPA: TatD family hydrolase, partial [Actinomycetota bacterium]|nr:TatD family hydrolase [Actinomycetota bacterium]
DSHCHLDSLEGDLDEALQRAASAGVGTMITIGTDLPSSREAVRIASAHPEVYATVGIHPYDAEDFDEVVGAEIELLAGDPRVVAVGEVGLDFYRDHSSPAAQHRAFKAQIALAKRLGKPMVLHIREAFPQVIAQLEEAGPPETLIFHCFSGGAAEAEVAVGMGGFVSFAGNVSYKTAETLREAARVVPLDRLLVETDSPYLSPVPHRGKPNEPRNVADVGAALAAATGRPVEEIAEATTGNARRAFRLN